MFDRFHRSLESFNKVWLGALSVTIIGVVVAGIVLIGSYAPDETHYRAEFAQAAQLRPGDAVTVAGITVGTVSELSLAGDHVAVGFTVRDAVHVGKGSRAAIKLSTLLGNRYLELSPGSTGELDNRTIGLANTSVPYDLQKALADATTTFEQVDADRIAQSFGTLAQSLNGVPDALPQALRNLTSLSSIISGRRDQIGTLLASTDTVTTMIRDQRAALGSLVLQGRDLLGDLVARRAALERLFASTAALVDRIKSILNDESGINQMLGSVREFMDMIARNDALLRNTLQTLPIPVRNLANAFGSGNAMDVNIPAALFTDSWMCAISGRAEQFNLPPYFKDCK